MSTFIGFLELAGWIVAVVALAAGVTYAVIKLFPSRADRKPSEDAPSAPAGGS
ncbi:MAG: hypothetical protein KJ051_07855 [Thermoleophilia bacterium]|nr:hypothetical protein [Thermoleophilia bacterium]